MTYSAFDISRAIGNNLGNAFKERRESQALDEILTNAMNSGSPEVLQQSFGKILSQLSPERQGPALQVLQMHAQKIQQKQDEARKIESALAGGYDPFAPAAVQAAQVKEKERLKGFNEVFGKQGKAHLSPVTNEEIENNKVTYPNLPEELQGMSKSDLIKLKSHPNPQIAKLASSGLEEMNTQDKLNKSNFEPESDKLEAKRVADLATEIENEYKAAQNEDMRLSRQIELDKEGNVSAPALVKALDFFGIPIGVLQNPATEEYRKLEADYVRDVSKVFPGGKITNYEVQAYLKTIPSLMNSPEGRKQIIKNRKLFNEAKKVRYDEYKKIIKENNGKKPPNMGILLEDRIASKLSKIEDEFISGIQKEVNKFQQPIRMIDNKGRPVDIPPDKIEAALKAGAKFS